MWNINVILFLFLRHFSNHQPSFRYSALSFFVHDVITALKHYWPEYFTLRDESDDSGVATRVASEGPSILLILVVIFLAHTLENTIFIVQFFQIIYQVIFSPFPSWYSHFSKNISNAPSYTCKPFKKHVLSHMMVKAMYIVHYLL